MAVTARISPDNNHTALRVKDLERVAAFYENTVGLPRLRAMGDAARPRTIFYPGLQLVRAEDDDTSVKGVFDHIGLSVDNIDEVCANLQAQGVEFETPLTQREIPEVGRSLKLAFFRDPEGNRIELVHWL
ncbi:MAG: VOC family protein [Chloroflexi bacterium]|nr:VOC family protein [Chloroflexota bacterium]